MIKVENLTKRYAGQTAIQDLNFEVSQGEIMGFLGPNGAGKTTTMRVLTCFLPPTDGKAENNDATDKITTNTVNPVINEATCNLLFNSNSPSPPATSLPIHVTGCSVPIHC